MSPKIKTEENTISVASSELINMQIHPQEESKDATIQVVPPRLITRNKYGLIEDANINYIYNDDGTINWRKMVKTEYLDNNRQKPKKQMYLS